MDAALCWVGYDGLLVFAGRLLRFCLIDPDLGLGNSLLGIGHGLFPLGLLSNFVDLRVAHGFGFFPLGFGFGLYRLKVGFVHLVLGLGAFFSM